MNKLKNINALLLVVATFVLPGTTQAASLLEIYQQRRGVTGGREHEGRDKEK